MTRGQEILIGLGILIGTPIAYPWIMDNLWDELVEPNLIAAAPDNAWGDAFLAGAPIFLLLVILAFGILLLIGKFHGKEDRDIER